ncbi:MAG: ATP-binding protein, partial [Myxococcota bacterium]
IRLQARLRLAYLSVIQETEPVTALLDDLDNPSRELEWRATTPELRPWLEALERATARLAAHEGSRLERVVQALHLDPIEAEVFLFVLAAATDPGIRALCGRLSGSAQPAWPTADLSVRLFGRARAWPLSAASALLGWDLVQCATPEQPSGGALTLDPSLARWIGGAALSSDLLARIAHPITPREALEDWPVDEVAERLRRMRDHRVPRVVVRVSGPRGGGRRTFANLVARRLGLEAMNVDFSAIDAEDRRRAALHVQRHAWLERCAPVWSPSEERGAARTTAPAPYWLQFVLAGPGEHAPLPNDVPSVDVTLPLPGLRERAALWTRWIPGAEQWPPEAVHTLAGRHRVTIGDVMRCRGLVPSSAPAAAEAFRASMRGELGELARRLPTTFTRDDLVVPESIAVLLEDLHYEAAARNALWEDKELARLFPQGRSLVALFTGPPGTGKTMSAQILARSLGLDLFRIDLSAMVSKYIGETSKNIERILSAAERLDVVLFFDEADALFGKRTEIKDAHDRFANTDTNYLLQAIEAWPGVAILASNKRMNLDEAFVRRLRYIVDFPTPDAELRRQLWQKLFGQMLPYASLEAMAPLLERLASTINLSGAQIKNALLTARLGAHRDKTPPTHQHLLAGIDREMLKIGRGLSRSERERLSRHGAR